MSIEFKIHPMGQKWIAGVFFPNCRSSPEFNTEAEALGWVYQMIDDRMNNKLYSVVNFGP